MTRMEAEKLAFDLGAKDRMYCYVAEMVSVNDWKVTKISKFQKKN